MTRGTPPQHGERRCYLRGCRLPECLDAHYRYMSRYRLDAQRGQQRRQDIGPVQQHTNNLIATGWTQAQISRASGVPHRAVGAILGGHQPTVANSTANRILTVPVGPAPEPLQYIDATGTVRRLRALIAIGHTVVSLAPHIGINENALAAVVRHERPQVRATTAAAAKAAYRQLSRTPGISRRARNIAKNRGWYGPLAWGETTIDDPKALPETDLPEPELGRNELAAHRRAEVEHLDSFGLSEQDIANRVGIALSTVQGIVRELHRGERRERKSVAA